MRPLVTSVKSREGGKLAAYAGTVLVLENINPDTNVKSKIVHHSFERFNASTFGD